jgi:signal transduction histidine kinase
LGSQPVNVKRQDGTGAPAIDLAPVGIVATIAIVLAIGIFVVLRSHFETMERERFEREAAYYSMAFTAEVKRHVDSLAAFRAFVSATRGVDRWEFADFAKQTLPGNPGFASVLWVPVVPQSARADYEARLQKDGLYGLRIREAGANGALETAPARDTYFPVSYLEPFPEHGSLIGVDLAGDPTLRALFETARASGHLAASPPMAGALLGAGPASLVIAFPLMSAPAHDAALQGFALGVLRLDQILDKAMSGPQRIEVVIAYVGAGTQGDLIYRKDWGSNTASGIGDWLKDGLLGKATAFSVAGQNFVLALRSDASMGAGARLLEPFGAALLILALAGLLCQHLYAAQTAKNTIESTVMTRTAALNRANQVLQNEIAQRREAEESLRAERDKAESANRAKSEFLATMNHELRTPLNAIIGFSSLLAKGGGQCVENQDEFLKQIHEGGIKLLALINELLEISQMDAGRIQLSEEEIDLSDVIANVFEKLGGLADAGGVDLQTDIPGRLPLLRSDERRLQKAITHLVSNAIKFTPAGGYAQIRLREEPGRGLILSVTDNGVGIPEGQEERVLEPFVQLDAKLSRTHQGAGLGLSYVKRITDLHQADLRIKSGLGRGTCVTLTFPVHRIVRRSEVA